MTEMILVPMALQWFIFPTMPSWSVEQVEK